MNISCGEVPLVVVPVGTPGETSLHLGANRSWAPT